MNRSYPVAILIWAASGAQAMIDPCYADMAIARAESVIQIVNIAVAAPGKSGTCAITGEVARSFRGRFHLGDKVSTVVACTGDPEVLCGSMWYDPVDLAAAGAIEIHVEAAGDPAIGAESILLLDAPTDAIVWTSSCGN